MKDIFNNNPKLTSLLNNLTLILSLLKTSFMIYGPTLIKMVVRIGGEVGGNSGFSAVCMI